MLMPMALDRNQGLAMHLERGFNDIHLVDGGNVEFLYVLLW
jgi:hypothetical protein